LVRTKVGGGGLVVKPLEICTEICTSMLHSPHRDGMVEIKRVTTGDS
jgi:hypothetical protein